MLLPLRCLIIYRCDALAIRSRGFGRRDHAKLTICVAIFCLVDSSVAMNKIERLKLLILVNNCRSEECAPDCDKTRTSEIYTPLSALLAPMQHPCAVGEWYSDFIPPVLLI
jgi:hypothetical protein